MQEEESTCLHPEKIGRNAFTPETSDWLWVIKWRRMRAARRMAEVGKQQMPRLHIQHSPARRGGNTTAVFSNVRQLP